jgi:cytochrome oxidase assembly protein ShyY1
MRYRFLLRPGWVAALTALLLLTAAFVGLGLWQFDRAHRTHKLTAAELAERDQAVPLDRLLAEGGLKDSKSLGHGVVISGTFDGALQLLVPDRETQGRRGSYVITPLKLADGTVVVVNRGWTDAATAPAAPGGPVTVTGWLAAPESTDAATTAALTQAAQDPEHRIAAIDIAVLVNKWPYHHDKAYVSALSPAQDGLTPVPAPAPPSGKTTWNILNVGYTLQWWVFGIIAIWWSVGYIRRQANPAEAADDGDGEDEDEGEDDEPSEPSEDGENAAPDLTPRSPAPESSPSRP